MARFAETKEVSGASTSSSAAVSRRRSRSRLRIRSPGPGRSRFGRSGGIELRPPRAAESSSSRGRVDSGLLPDGDVLGAVRGERVALPAAPTLAQCDSGELSHQIELGRPRIAKRHRDDLDSAVIDPIVMGDESLPDDVVLIEAEMGGADGERLEPFAWRKLSKSRNDDLDDEAAVRLQMRRGVAKASNLLVLCRQVHDRVRDEVGDRERPLDSGRGEVADRHVDLIGTG